jgi:hypothetical protein
MKKKDKCHVKATRSRPVSSARNATGKIIPDELILPESNLLACAEINS